MNKPFREWVGQMAWPDLKRLPTHGFCRILTLRLFMLTVFFVASNHVLSVEPSGPNVILIMADDLGYQDLGCYGHPAIRTPHLDQLAAQGVRMTDFHSGATVCTPSRMALLTGYYPYRLGWRRGVIGHLMEPATGLDPNIQTMGEIFASAGYATGLIGKWHLGDEAPFRPHRQGFGENHYLNKSNNQTKQVWQGDQVVEEPFDNRLLTERWFERAEAFVTRHADKKFFLYLPLTAPHFPVEPHPGFDGRSAFGAYGDVVEEVDERFGQLMLLLKRLDLSEHTLVWFLSDNGPQPGEAARSYPYRGLKWDALEGGTRVPSIVSWPGQLPPGRTLKTLMAAIDVLPTLVEACHLTLPSPSFPALSSLDGVSQWSVMTGDLSGPLRHELLYWHGQKGLQALRQGRWKLFPKAMDAGLESLSQGAVLFDLEQDPGEEKDLALSHPARVEAMLLRYHQYEADLESRAIGLGKLP